MDTTPPSASPSLPLDVAKLQNIGWARLRPLVSADAEPMVEIANDRRIWRNLTHRFPHPYTPRDAEEFIGAHLDHKGPSEGLAFEVGDSRENAVFAGMIGMSRTIEPAEHENMGVIDFGYWLGADYWGRGLATVGVKAFLSYTIETFSPRRIEAKVFGWNPASARVLEKCGLQLEGRLRSHIVKGADVTDELIYGLVVDEHQLR